MRRLSSSPLIPILPLPSALLLVPRLLSHEPIPNRTDHSYPNLSAHFDRVVDRTSARSWSLAITELAHAGDASEALRAFACMRRLGVAPIAASILPAVNSCAALSAALPGRQLHLVALRLGLLPADLFLCSALLDMYSKCHQLDDARQLFEETPQRNAVLWTALLTGHVCNGAAKEAILVFKDFMAEMGGGEVDAVAVVAALSACARAASKAAAGGVHGLSVKLGLEMETKVGNTLIDAYAKSGELAVSKKVFDGMVGKDVVSWNSIIALYAQNGLSTEALDVYCKMLNSGGGVRYDAVTLSAALFACAHAGALQTGKCTHDQVIRMGLEEDVYVGTSVIDMYCKCGRLGMARKAFNRIKDKNIKSWSAMVAGYGMHGRGQEALEIFYEMRRSGMQPNAITFVSVLAACSHAGLVADGRHWFDTMTKEYGIEPGVEHYACMVDLLGRSGHLSEAYELINGMRIKPDFVVWGALLSACRTHKNIELGEISARKLFELDPKNCGYYVSLSNIYADAGRWQDVQRTRVMIKTRGIVKPPGYSMVELKGRIHVFLVGDKEHPQHREIYNYLEMLSVRLLEAGYVPDTGSVLHDVDQEEKETVLRVHSEKLAVAFAIINTAGGAPIQVIKNLRVCGDCHAAIKLIAKLVEREIVVRDSHRFHHFKGGFCSCGDYW